MKYWLNLEKFAFQPVVGKRTVDKREQKSEILMMIVACRTSEVPMPTAASLKEIGIGACVGKPECQTDTYMQLIFSSPRIRRWAG